MENFIFTIFSKLRSSLNLLIRSNSNYFLATRQLKPLSDKFGFDRGTPIDRFWIESFLEKNQNDIHGVCLEVTDNKYLTKFGKGRVTKMDVLDINKNNKKATIYSDIKKLSRVVKDNIYDCIVLTHMFGIIDDFNKAIEQCYKVLKKNGVLLATSACFSPVYDQKFNYWRFTVAGAKYAFSKYFKNLQVESYGNVLAGQCFWVGMSQEELTKEELEYNDPRYPCIVAIRAVK